ncbi:hypothetical protein EB169_06435 [archaeon]|nr:hypothetical protein [archaeon]
MDTLKNIFDNAAKQTVDSTYNWFQYPSASEDIPEVKQKKEKTITERIKEGLKQATQSPAQDVESYQRAVEYFKAQRAKLPGRVETGGMIPPRAPSQISQMPGATRGLRAESFTDKIAEVRARMRAFATDKYYSDITYGK